MACKLLKLGWYRYSYALNRLRGEGCFSIDLSVLKFLLRSANHILALLGALSKEKTYGNAVWILFSLRMAVPFAKVRTNIGRRYLNSGKSKFLSIMCFRGFRVWYYDLNFIFCRILRRFVVDGSRFTYKGNNDYGVDFRSLSDVRFLLRYALLPGHFSKDQCFFDVAALRSLRHADCNSFCFTWNNRFGNVKYVNFMIKKADSDCPKEGKAYLIRRHLKPAFWRRRSCIKVSYRLKQGRFC